MGRQWYEDGKLLNKKNTFIDTIACATHLADTGVCDGNKIVLRGGSAGGLAVGACITMNTERFAGAIAEVPFVDVTNTMCDPSLPLTVTEWEEWGDPRQEPYFSYISSYSPYDNVRAVKYPDLYITAGLNDPRVSYHEPAKWAAKIRHLSPESTVVFRCEMDSGHGGPSGRYEQWRDEAKTLSFALASVSSTPLK
jgi:oligopeptidase B